jgi:hypothetical protein
MVAVGGASVGGTDVSVGAAVGAGGSVAGGAGGACVGAAHAVTRSAAIRPARPVLIFMVSPFCGSMRAEAAAVMSEGV